LAKPVLAVARIELISDRPVGSAIVGHVGVEKVKADLARSSLDCLAPNPDRDVPAVQIERCLFVQQFEFVLG
jgi:hypothetical protein